MRVLKRAEQRNVDLYSERVAEEMAQDLDAVFTIESKNGKSYRVSLDYCREIKVEYNADWELYLTTVILDSGYKLFVQL